MRNGYPLVELHRHLDGNVRLATVLDIAESRGIELPADDAETLRPFVQITEPEPDLLGFLRRFEVLRTIMADYDAVRRIARENVEDAAAEEIDYLELRFSPWFMAEPHDLDPVGRGRGRLRRHRRGPGGRVPRWTAGRAACRPGPA